MSDKSNVTGSSTDSAGGSAAMRAGPIASANPVLRLVFSEFLVLALILVYFAAMAPFAPGFATGPNLQNVLLTFLPLFIVAVGETVVLLTGGIDLSVTSTMALCSITGAWLMNVIPGLAGVALGISAMLAAGMLVGLGNGLCVSKLRMPAFIVTLTSMMFFSGLAIWLTRSQNIGNLPPAFNALGGNAAIELAIVGLLALAADFMLRRSVWGRWIYATGDNPKSAEISGVPVRATTTSAYVVSGALAAVGAVLYTGQAESGSPVLGQRLLLDVVGGTVIGGTSLFGGKGKVLWTLFGVLFLKLLDNSLNLLDLSYFSIMIVKGAVILLAALLDALRNRVLS